MTKIQLPIAFPKENENNEEWRSFMMPRPFYTIYPSINLYGFTVVENLINIFIYNNDYSRNINFHTPNYTKTFQCFDYSVLTRDVMRNLNVDIIEFFRSNLRNGYYLQYYIDSFYVSNYQENFMKDHCEHALLIYGYDDEKKSFLAFDYFDFEKMDRQLVSYEEIRLSNDKFQVKKSYGIDWSGNSCMVEIFKLDSMTIRKPCLDLFKAKLSMFLNNNQLDTYEGLTYGIQFFDVMANRIINENYGPLKHFAVIISHIYLMSLRMEILSNNYPKLEYLTYKEIFEELCTKAKILKNLYMKYTITHSAVVQNKVIKNIYDLRDQYMEALKQLLSLL